MRKKLFITILSLIIFSCRNKREHQDVSDTYAPKVTQVEGYPVPATSTKAPEVIPAINVKRNLAGKPSVVPLVTNFHAFGEPLLVAAGDPIINISGVGNCKGPLITAAINRPFRAGTPEVVVAKDASIKDVNPQNFSSFKVRQGLKHPLIDCMMQDKSGNIWIGTFNGGVSKYDGKFFTNYTTAQGLSYEGVWSMLQDRNGNIWLGTCGGGVCKYDGKYFTNYSTTEGLTNNIVYCIIEDSKGFLWFGTKGGVSKYDGKNFTNYTSVQGLPNDIVHCMAEDHAGNIWLGTLGGGISKFNGKSFENYATTEGLINDYVNSMYMDRQGNLWLGTNGGLSEYNGKYFRNYTIEQGLTDNYVNCIFEDHTGTLWFGTQGGITQYDPFQGGNTKNCTHLKVAQGLTNNKVTGIIEDKAGNLWFSTKGGGISRYDARFFTHFTSAEGLCGDEIMRILEDKDGNLWFGSWGGGISRFDGKSFSNYTKANGLCDNNVYSVIQDTKKNLWIGTKHGVSKFDGQYFTNYDARQGFSDAEIWSILEDKKGNIWFGTFGDGTIKYDGKAFTHYSVAQGLSNVFIMDIIQDENNNIWFGIYGGGVCKYDGKSFTQFTTLQGICTNEVMPIMEDKSGNFWFGTIGKGILKYEPDKNKSSGKLTNYTTAQGLSNEVIMGIMQDQSGNMLFSTRNGLNKMVSTFNSTTQQGVKNQNTHLFKNYSFEDGFLGVNCYLHSILEDSKGTIWIGTSDYLTCFHPEGEIPDTIAPNIQLCNVALYNENVNWTDLQARKDTTLILGNGVSVSNFQFDDLSKWYNLPLNLSLAYGNNYISFEYVGITTRSPYKVNYQYKLEGLDENWSAISDRTEAPYGNVPPGNYTFKVKAMNSAGYWSPEFTYAFTIRPPWWMMWWFRTTAFLFFILLLYGFYRYRLNQILRLQTIRNKIAADLHDDIGSTLNSISIYSQVAIQKAPVVVNELDQIGVASRKIVDSMSDIVWTINPKNDSFEQIILRLRSLTYHLLKAKNIEHTFSANDNMNHRKLTIEQRRNFYLIYKEALNNLVKHSGASSVVISLVSESNSIILGIKDNGRGFNLSHDSSGNGLFNMKRRAEEIKAQLKITSLPGEGTTIQLKLCV